MKYLIYTQKDDAHAWMVYFALESLGHEVHLLLGEEQSNTLRQSIVFDANHTSWKISTHQAIQSLNDYQVVWYRRPSLPKLSREDIHPLDLEFMTQENRLFFEGLTTLISTQSWWVNHPTAARRANAKLLQLHVAKSCGLSIPKTLCSNDPNDIRRFVKKYEKKGVIYKPFCSYVWKHDEPRRALYTALVQEQDLPKDEQLRLTPGLFQNFIPKAYELRITCFGAHCVAVKIDSQPHEAGRVDWRKIPSHELQLSSYALPQVIEYKIQSLMRRLGLMFACIDMIVTPEQEYIFLEVNEQGQFLWMEELDSSIQLLDRFVNFLRHRTFYFHWAPSDQSLSVLDFKQVTNQALRNTYHDVA
jgi:glutathione synthase/RimK-type ligase-like ATP-grasp enzyme